jgi:WD40 repeat protein
MVTSSEDGTVKIWETRSGTIQRSYSHASPVNDVVIHPNQGEIISCDRGGSVRIWDLAENNCSHELIPEEEVSVSSVTVASDGSTLCAGSNSVGHWSYVRHRGQIINTFIGERLCLASGFIPREDHTGTNYPFQSSWPIHHSGSPFPGRQASCNL